MTMIALSPTGVAAFPDGGGHAWVYLQYALGLQASGHEVVWLERLRRTNDEAADQRRARLFVRRLRALGLADRLLLLYEGPGGDPVFLHGDEDALNEAARRAEILFNFDYRLDPGITARFRRRVLVDIDPGLLQFWVANGQLELTEHDAYFTIGETVGTQRARFPDCGLRWERFRPPVFLPAWPFVFSPGAEAFTTVSSWWGGNGKGEWINDGRSLFFENNKRVTFLRFAGVAAHAPRPLELASYFGSGDPVDAPPPEGGDWEGEHEFPSGLTDYTGDAADRAALLCQGWRLRHSAEVASSPSRYRRYVQGSRGEFSCAKPSCMAFANAWVSDRTICYLASGKPAVVQHTGESEILPDGEGLHRFRTFEEALTALDAVDEDYENQCRAARALAVSRFDSAKVLPELVARALSVA